MCGQRRCDDGRDEGRIGERMLGRNDRPSGVQRSLSRVTLRYIRH